MSSVQERLQIKREPLDKWSVREQLCLAFAVAKSGDQNWMSVSRMLKPFGDPNRPVDWLHQKNCAAQYGSLLENVETPKRKKRVSGLETTVETPVEAILRKLTKERILELDKCLLEEKLEFAKLQEDMTLLQSGNVSEEMLDKWCKEIDDEEKEKEEEAVKHALWLKEREQRKQEIERAWRPFAKVNLTVATKRKTSDSADSLMELDSQEEPLPSQPETGKPALSPLLTSLLKSPSQVQGVVTSSILHSAITSQRPTVTSTSAIASLLNTSPDFNVQQNVQQITSNIILPEPHAQEQTSSDSITSDLLQDAVDSLPNIKVEDFENTILSSDEPLPEMKNEEVEVIISDLIQNADIVSDPEQHLQLDDNEDIITNLDNELQVLCDEEKAAEAAEKEKLAEKPIQKIDPFEFEEDPDISEIPKHGSTSTHTKYQEPIIVEEDSSSREPSPTIIVAKESVSEEKQKEKVENLPGSVEIVEVVVMEETEIDKQLNKTQIQDIVHSIKVEPTTTYDETEDVSDVQKQPHCEDVNEPSTSSNISLQLTDDNKKTNINEITHTISTEFSESFFDDLAMEVNKLDKSGKAKRDYSRTKKRETEKDFDILLAVEKAVNAEFVKRELPDEFSDQDQDDKKSDSYKSKIKVETDRSSSPWTEEEEISTTRSKRRYSTPATPTDSVPNSPASSSAYFDDDREHKNWKKSVMLLYNRLTTHKYSSLFSKPITDEMAPNYHSMIYRPMDLQTLRRNIESGVVRTTQELQRDVLLMFVNATMYNKPDDLPYKSAISMQQEVMQHFEIFVQAQLSDTPQRRETRTSEPTNKRKRTSEDSNTNTRVKKRKED